MADEPEPPEHSEDGDIEIDVESVDQKRCLSGNFILAVLQIDSQSVRLDDLWSRQNCNAIRKNKGQWTDQEVRVFEKGLELFGHKWTKIADLLETRTAAQEIEESESLILISALTSSKVHLKMDETSEELNVDDSLSSAEDVTYSTG
eukprot:gene4451-20694_t